MANFLSEKGANPGRSGHRLAQEAERTIEGTRNLLSVFLGVESPERIIFTLNCTDALNIAIHGIVREGSHVVTTALEHNSVTRVLNELKDRKSIEVSVVSPDEEGYIKEEEFKKNIRKDTSLLILNHASNVTGSLQPVGEIAETARKKGIPLLIDAAQSAGAVKIDLKSSGIAFCALPGHKGLLGPTGTGALYVAEGIGVDTFRQGGSGTDSSSPRQPAKFPFHLEAGTPNTVGIAALTEGVKYVMENFESIREKEKEIVSFFLEEFKKIPGLRIYGPKAQENRVGVISINLDGWSPDELGAVLDENFNIAVRTGLHCAPGAHRCLGTFPEGTVRVSCGPFNSVSQAESLVGALKEMTE